MGTKLSGFVAYSDKPTACEIENLQRRFAPVANAHVKETLRHDRLTNCNWSVTMNFHQD